MSGHQQKILQLLFSDYLESMQDQLAELDDARQAIDLLREEKERERQQMMQQERFAMQTKMHEKIQLLQQKKHVSKWSLK